MVNNNGMNQNENVNNGVNMIHNIPKGIDQKVEIGGVNQDENNLINDFDNFSLFPDEIYDNNNTPQKIENNYINYYPTQNLDYTKY